MKINYPKKFKFGVIFLCIFISVNNCKKSYDIDDCQNMSIFEYLEQPKEKWDIGISALILSKNIYPEIEFQKYLNIINSMARRVHSYVGNRVDVGSRISALNRVIFKDYGFEYDKNDFLGRKTENHYISKVFDRRKGVCTSLPLLYMIIAEKLKYPIYAVEAPEHHFCRYVSRNNLEKGGYVNIEITSGGKIIPDVVYIDDMKIPKKAYKNGVYMRTLLKSEYIGSLLHINAVSYMLRGDYEEAIKYLEKSLELNPRNSHNHKVLAHCYKKVCNSLETAIERKPIYFKALKHDMIAENLGRAPRCPDDYWKSQVGLGESRNLNRPMTTRELVKFRNEYNREIKRLEAKYHDYFE